MNPVLPPVGATVRLGRQWDSASPKRERFELKNRRGLLTRVRSHEGGCFTVDSPEGYWIVDPSIGDEWIEIPPKPAVGPRPPALSDYFITPSEVAAVRRERDRARETHAETIIELAAVRRERDELAAQVRSLTAERDTALSAHRTAMRAVTWFQKERDALHQIVDDVALELYGTRAGGAACGIAATVRGLQTRVTSAESACAQLIQERDASYAECRRLREHIERISRRWG